MLDRDTDLCSQLHSVVERRIPARISLGLIHAGVGTNAPVVSGDQVETRCIVAHRQRHGRSGSFRTCHCSTRGDQSGHHRQCSKEPPAAPSSCLLIYRSITQGTSTPLSSPMRFLRNYNTPLCCNQSTIRPLCSRVNCICLKEATMIHGFFTRRSIGIWYREFIWKLRCY